SSELRLRLGRCRVREDSWNSLLRSPSFVVVTPGSTLSNPDRAAWQPTDRVGGSFQFASEREARSCRSDRRPPAVERVIVIVVLLLRTRFPRAREYSPPFSHVDWFFTIE